MNPWLKEICFCRVTPVNIFKLVCKNTIHKLYRTTEFHFSKNWHLCYLLIFTITADKRMVGKKMHWWSWVEAESFIFLFRCGLKYQIRIVTVHARYQDFKSSHLFHKTEMLRCKSSETWLWIRERNSSQVKRKMSNKRASPFCYHFCLVQLVTLHSKTVAFV